MKHPIRIRTVLFDIPLSIEEVQYFRKAVTSVVSKLQKPLEAEGVDTTLFHNHDKVTGNPINRYPLIQYKTINGKASITAVNEGLSALEIFLSLLSQEAFIELNRVHIKGLPISLAKYGYSRINPLNFTITLLPHQLEYVVHYWLPLEEERHKLWEVEQQLTKKIEILEQCMARQLERVLKGVGYTIKTNFSFTMSHLLQSHHKIKEYNYAKYPFTCCFRTNLLLPEHIGVGQVPAIGFGNMELFKKQKYFAEQAL